MNVSLVMTILGADRPGLVEAISSVVAEHGGNWVESRMSHLGGHFAGILRVDVARQRADELAGALEKLRQTGLDVVVHTDQHPLPDEGRRKLQLELVGQDHPGIVSEVTRVLASHGVNVEELTTQCEAAATTGQILFRAEALLRMPSGGQVEALREQLERIASDLMVDITLHPETDQE